MTEMAPTTTSSSTSESPTPLTAAFGVERGRSGHDGQPDTHDRLGDRMTTTATLPSTTSSSPTTPDAGTAATNTHTRLTALFPGLPW